MIPQISQHFRHLMNIGIPVFKSFQNIFFCGYGTKELVLDGVRIKKKINRIRALETAKKVDREVVLESKETIAEISIMHGFYYIGVGTLGCLTSAHYFNWIDLGRGYSVINSLCSVSFLFASLYSLQSYIHLYEEACKLSNKPLAAKLKTAAIMGIINNLGYCIATLVSLLGGPTAVFVMFGGIALITGCIKILYDYFIVNKVLEAPLQALKC